MPKIAIQKATKPMSILKTDEPVRQDKENQKYKSIRNELEIGIDKAVFMLSKKNRPLSSSHCF